MYVICKYCNQKISKYSHLRHEEACPRKPEVLESVMEFIRKNSKESILPRHKYDRLVAGTDYPVYRTLTRYLGTWNEIAERAGLLPGRDGKDKQEKFHFPVLYRELHRISEMIHEGVYGPNMAEYRIYKESPHNHPSELAHEFGDWWGVLEWAGLERAPIAVYQQRRRERLEKALEEEKKISEKPDDQTEGLHIEGLICRPAWRIIREWDPRQKTYIPVAQRQVFEVR